MHRILIYVAYGWLTLGGLLHFAVDVVSQYLRHKRPPGPETTLYWGLNSAYALGQVAFGVFALLIARKAIGVLDEPPAIALTFAAAAGWLTIAILFLEYKEPRFVLGLFVALAVAAVATR